MESASEMLNLANSLFGVPITSFDGFSILFCFGGELSHSSEEEDNEEEDDDEGEECSRIFSGLPRLGLVFVLFIVLMFWGRISQD